MLKRAPRSLCPPTQICPQTAQCQCCRTASNSTRHFPAARATRPQHALLARFPLQNRPPKALRGAHDFSNGKLNKRVTSSARPSPSAGESTPTCRLHEPGVIRSGLLHPTLVPSSRCRWLRDQPRVWRTELKGENMAAPKVRRKHEKLKPKPKTEGKSWQTRNAARKEKQTAHAAKEAEDGGS